ncbi:MAG TPA: response regulator transcription factor [Acidimicrobiales bacterium]|nr:response regulator transcription factor [Acidimicrobiales bacterium]
MVDESAPDEATILVVDDDRGVRTALERALRFEGYRVRSAADGLTALEMVTRGAEPGGEIDAMVLDLTMPNLDGLQVCRRIRAEGRDLPILVLTARHGVSDRVAGLDAGADDYLVKPFALEELLARIRALLRRASPAAGPDSPVIEVGDLRLDPVGHTVTRGERAVELTRTEFSLLEYLMANAGQVLTRDQIYEHVWGYDAETASNTLDVYIGYLRRKTESGDEPRLIHTVRGVGHVIRAG